MAAVVAAAHQDHLRHPSPFRRHTLAILPGGGSVRLEGSLDEVGEAGRDVRGTRSRSGL
jgi:hypothetical protein